MSARQLSILQKKNILTSVALLFSFIPLDYEPIVVVQHGINFYH